ncbi:MAG: DUF4129 domain-containing protein [Gemmataceae bacterium]|nr:DUF4129 domain-containing protein [Gemmataceae bacterium]
MNNRRITNLRETRVKQSPTGTLLMQRSSSDLEIRPRTTGEILDDAWQLVLPDAPVLLAMSGLFLVPALAALLLLLTMPQPRNIAARMLMPALVALLLPMSGLGAGACQVLFRRRAEGKPVTLGGCLFDALRHGLDHVVVRSLVLLMTLIGLPFLLMPGLAVWIGTATAHAILADGQVRWWKALDGAGKQGQRVIGKSSAVVLVRLPLLSLTFVNMHALIQIALWALDQLAGFDMAFAGLVLSLSNPVYDLTLLMIAILLMTPYIEASNYLLHVDARARYEGLDLWYRAKRLFPAMDQKLAVAIVLGIASFLLTTKPVAAADARHDTVHGARQEIARITKEVNAANPFVDGEPWLPALQDVAERLDESGSHHRGRFHWFAQKLPGFAGQQNRDGALGILNDLDRQLALIEESLQPAASGSALSKSDIKALLPPEPTDDPARPTRTTAPRRTEREVKQPVRKDDPATDGPGRKARQGPGAVTPRSESGFSPTTWTIVAVLLFAMAVVAVVLGQRRRPLARPPAASAKADPNALTLDALLTEADKQGGEGLWRQADDLARSGKFLDAVRSLYMAVLAMLHRADLIRYGPTRTNGEYLQQLRAKEGLYRPFRGLTGLFEVKWYGERSCAPEDFETCRRLAENVRAGMGATS